MVDVENNIFDDENDDEEIDPSAHKSLLEGINRLRKTQHIKQPTRTEPSLVQDEFHLVKSNFDKPVLTVNDLFQALKKSKKHLNIAKELKKVHNKQKVLKKPLEKPVADRIQRIIAYEKAKKSLSRWNAVVTQNQYAEQLTFPLDCETVYINTGELKKPPQRAVKSELMMQMEALDSQLEAIRKAKAGEEDEPEPLSEKAIREKLTKEELIARRKEILYLKMRESQKSAKAYLKNKIKSKKYHKLLKREKLKEQLKEFEKLQKTNPELALEKLEQLEKSRMKERATLRHKNTGTWAKNLQIRAKYDRDARKDLAEQLALSRELTQKQNVDSDDNDENENEEEVADEEDYDPFNPWVKVKGKKSQTNEVADFVSDYRKYWLERNKSEEDMKNYKNTGASENKEDGFSNDIEMKSETEKTNQQETTNAIKNGKKESSFLENSGTGMNTSGFKEEIKVQATKNKKQEKVATISKALKQKSNTKKKNKVHKEIKIENGWLIEEIPNIPGKNKKNLKSVANQDIDAIFDKAEDTLKKKVNEKVNLISKSLESNENTNASEDETDDEDGLKEFNDLSFKGRTNRPDIDEELIETPYKEKNVMMDALKANNKSDNTNLNESTTTDQIDPEKYTKIKPKILRTSLPDMVNSDALVDEELEDNNNDNMKNMTIVEAFEDDDIVVDFEKEREDERKKNTDEVDLTLPGWGSWAGCGISKEKQQSKRQILKFPKEEKRRDENKVNVYINEEVNNKKLKEHLVSEIPFPFTSVKDYEASIRAPIGRTFIPETAFRLLTRPSVITKKGHIIEPMDESILMKPPQKPRTEVDRRIAALDKDKNKKSSK